MQPYRDNPFTDPNATPNVGYHYSTGPLESATGDIPLTGPAIRGPYSSVDSGANLSQAANPTRPASQTWDSSHYGQGSTWINEQEKQTKRSKIVIIVSVIALVIIITVSVTLGVVLSRSNNSGNNNSTENSNNANSNGTQPNPNAVDQPDPNDPSTFSKNPNLKHAFYGVAYTPVGSQLPSCGNSQAAVIQDIQLLSQITKRIRLYGADCNQTALVLEAIKQTKVDMTVWLGNYIVVDDNNAAYERQKEAIKNAIEAYGVDHIAGITVGNEVILNYVTEHSIADVNSAAADVGANILIANIQDTISMLDGMALSKHIEVGNSDAGSYFNNRVLQSVEYGLSNVHPWFAQVTVETSAAWTTQFFQTTNVDVANALPNRPAMYIAETGWPTKSSDAQHESNGKSTASEANLQIFIDTFVCQANAAGTRYFFFEFADEKWKDDQFGGVEGWWGLFNENRTFKNLQLPDCTPP